MEKTNDNVDVCQFKVTLLGTKHAIWRRLQVPSDLDFKQFAKAVQDVMGWRDHAPHIFEFEGESHYKVVSGGSTSDVDGKTRLDAAKERIEKHFTTAGESKAVYEYATPDGWKHEVVFEKRLLPVKGKSYPCCVAGRRACPPDVLVSPFRGVAGYEEGLLKVLANKRDADYEERVKWLEENGYSNYRPEHLKIGELSFRDARVIEDGTSASTAAAAATAVPDAKPKKKSSGKRTRKESEPDKQPSGVFEFKISLSRMKPPLWRRIQVPDDATFEQLGRAIIDAMGWRDEDGSKRYEFTVEDKDGDYRIVNHFEEYYEGVEECLNESKELIAEHLDANHPKATFVYDLDNDQWEHRVFFEDKLPASKSKKVSYPRCSGGSRACPPDGCGGVNGYKKLLSALGNPQNPAHEGTVAWLREHDYENFDPEHFSPKEVVFRRDDDEKKG